MLPWSRLSQNYRGQRITITSLTGVCGRRWRLTWPKPYFNHHEASCSHTQRSVLMRNLWKMWTCSYISEASYQRHSLEKKTEERVTAAHSVFGFLNRHVFKIHAFTTITKIMVFSVVELSTTLDVCGSWTTYRRQSKGLQPFNIRNLGKFSKFDRPTG